MRPGSMNGWNYTEGNPVNATDPTGQVQWQPPSSGYEKMVEWQYELTDPANIHLEFRYRSARRDRPTYERPDIIRPDGGDVYEIEPYPMVNTAINEATYYAHELNSDRVRNYDMSGKLPASAGGGKYDWREVFWQLGNPNKFPPIDIPGGVRVTSVRGETVPEEFRVPWCVNFYAESPAQGAITWWYYQNSNCDLLTDAELAALGVAEHFRRGWAPPSAQSPVPVYQKSPLGKWLVVLLLLGKECIDSLSSSPVWALIP
jgi:hypothetical protein